MTAPRCFACGGPYHPATGHWFGPAFPDVFYCGRCARYFVRWMSGHLKRKWNKGAFYEEAQTSVRAGVWP